MNIKKYIGVLVLFLALLVSSCQKQEVLTDDELFEGVEVTNKMMTSTTFDEEYINDDEDEDNDPDGDEDEEDGKARASVNGLEGHISK